MENIQVRITSIELAFIIIGYNFFQRVQGNKSFIYFRFEILLYFFNIDYGLITLLYQDEVGGLEVRGTNNTWIPAKPMKDAILINAGDFLEIYTNGKLPATVHRVVIPPEEVKRKTSRQSIVFFVHPDHETTIYPLPKFIEDQDDQKIDGTEKRGIFTSTKEFTNGYQPVNSLEHLFRRLNSTYQY